MNIVIVENIYRNKVVYKLLRESGDFGSLPCVYRRRDVETKIICRDNGKIGLDLARTAYFSMYFHS